jgi:filamentous hemagglutinin
MNQGLYKLVYSKVLNAYVPVSEAVRSRCNKSGKRVRKLDKQVCFLFLFVGFVNVNNVLADTTLPAGLNIKNIVTGTEIASATANSINFRQLAPKAIVDWNTLNLSKGHSFNVDMLRSWSMLNRIHDINPSTLSGNVNAAGNIYFINTNGIIFGNGAQFNVGSLYAGTLDITNDLFNSGFVSDQPLLFKPVFELAGAIDKKLVVEAGATINAAPGGKVLLFSETVENSGIINTPDGQTILAAGKKVYLADAQNPADPTKPVGFLVEVDGGGAATNLGKIIADRGNITIAGLAVNQNGTLSATTSVRANGSIYLQAQDKVLNGGQTGARDGIVALAKGSITEVTPELGNLEEITKQQAFTYADDRDSSKLKKSEVKIEAAKINIDGKVAAKGGTVTAKNPDDLAGTSIYIGSNAVIDVSGVDATAPMSRNQLSPELFSGELADQPILRDGPLYRQKVFVDARKGANGLINLEPFDKISKVTIAEALTKGGTIKLSTTGDLVVNKGAKLDVSGGSTTYAAGNLQETNLLLKGKLVPISEARSGVAYDRTSEFYIDKDDKTGSNAYRLWDLSGGGTAGWGEIGSGSTNSNLLKTKLVGYFVDSYLNGDNAGKLDLTVDDKSKLTKNLVMNGTVLANTKTSQQQLIAGKLPLGGEFKASANQLTLAKVAKEVTTQFGELLDPENYQSVISTAFLDNGFNRVDLSKTGSLAIDEDLSIKPNGNLALSRIKSQINANIIAPGSNVSVGQIDAGSSSSSTSTIADGVSISTAGVFTNDRPGIAGALSKPAIVNAGSINFDFVKLGKNVNLDASAGAHINAQGKLQEGKAGNIGLTSTNGALDDSITLKAYGFKKGGELTLGFADALNTPFTLNLAGNPNASSKDIDIDNAFFNKGGFSKFSLSGFDVNIGGASGASQEIYAAAQTWRLNEGIGNRSGTQNIAQAASPFVQPDMTRSPVSFGFAASNLGGTLTLAQNIIIRTDGTGGSVSLAAGKQVNVLGDIATPSGNIDIRINDKSGSLPYDPTQAIFVGEQSSLSALGSSQTLPDSQIKLLKTQVFNAGTINIDAAKGAVVVKNGALLNVSGTFAVTDTKTIEKGTKKINNFVRETLHGDAGSIKIAARDGLKVDGTLIGKAAGTGRTGSLDVGFTNTEVTRDPNLPLPTGSREFTISQQKQILAQNVTLGDTLKTDAGEDFTATSTDVMRGQISVQQITEGGFANVTVKSYEPNTALGLTNSVQLNDGVDLAITGNLKIDAALINVQDDINIVGGGTAKLSAGHITFKTPNLSIDNTGVLTGSSKLTTNSKQLYIDGSLGITGVNKTEINTALDIHGQGGIVANGDIKLAARQIYPNTKAEGVNNALSIEAIGENSKITVNSSGAKAKPVLSAAGTLNFKADDIVQNGVLSAPFGTINLEGKNSVTLTAGSTTSISANEQTIPYLTTQNVGKETVPKGQTLPDKGISIKSVKVDVKKDAVLDLSSSGKLFATEFVPGSGGSKDVLKGQANTYAILPSLGQEFSPTGYVGETVYLTGIAGLPSGNYTLLPASYALVPGAFMVEVNPAGSKLSRGETAQLLDGTSLTSGYRGDLATGSRDANWSTFKITNGAVFRTPAGETSRAPAQYQLTDLTEFFSNPINTDDKKVALPTDVGRLSLGASSTLVLDGQVIANKGKDAKGNVGDGLQVDISAEKIRVVSSVGAVDDSLQLTANSINALKADSVVLGGTNKLENGVNKITSVAKTVSIENNSASAINTPEIIITANDTLTVKTGAVIDTGNAATKPTQKIIESSGNGALLALSSKNDISYSRVGGTATASNGELNVEGGSILRAGNSLVVDATKSTTLTSNPSLQNGGNAYFGADRILLGNAPIDAVGSNLSNAALAALGELKALTLSSYNNLDIFGNVNFGNNKLDLTINAAGIAGHLANGETVGALANTTPAIITAKTFTLKNTTDAQFSNPAEPSGRDLQINATTVRLEGKDSSNTAVNSGKTEIAGFNNLNITANELRVAQTGSANFNVAKTTINTGGVTGETGEYTKDSAGALLKDTTTNFEMKGKDLTIAKLATATLGTSKEFGAKLGIAANNLTVASDIDLASGQLTLTSENNLNIENGANISAKSSAKEFYNITKDAPAGIVTLTSATGNVNINTGAVVDVTSQGAANAGKVKVQAKAGTANIVGDLKGAAAGAGKGGVLDVDVNTLANFTATDKQAKGFDETRQYRVRTGDVAITGTGVDALKSRQVGIYADAGKVIVSGDIIATAAKNSRIDLYGNKGVTLSSTANLKANSTQVSAEGGKVNIGSTASAADNTPDLLNFAAGSTVDVSGGVGGVGGEVNIIAPRTLNNTDVEVGQLETTFTGVKDKVKIVGNSVIDTALVDTANREVAINSANSFMTSVITDVTKGLQRLGLANNSQFAITPGAEFTNKTGGLVLDRDWSLHDWRYDPTTGAIVTDAALLATGKTANGKTLLAGLLSFRARDNININGTLSDAFSTASLSEVSRPAQPEVPEVPAVLDENGEVIIAAIPAIPARSASGVQGIDSWSYNIVAGADFTGANPLATNNTGTGNLTLANNKGIRTGTSDINIATGGDVKMSNGSSVIYTVGRVAEALTGFVAPSKNNPLYLTDGGDINLLAKGNIVGGEITNRQLINNYLFRDGVLGKVDATWWVQPELFKQSLATLGGGDLQIIAGGDVTNFSAILPTTARFDTVDVTTGKPTNKQAINGGGDLTLDVAGDLNGGVYLVAKGNGEINTGGSIEKPSGNALGPVLALQDGVFNVESRKDQYIEAIINPTLFTSSKANAGNTDDVYFNSYSDTAAVNLTSVLANIELGGKELRTASPSPFNNDSRADGYLPSTFSAVAFNGDFSTGRISALLPSASGNLELLAANNVTFKNNFSMSDADSALIANVANPDSKTLITSHANPLLHKNDSKPALIVAKTGSIERNLAGVEGIVVTTSKLTKVVAGKDIKNVSFNIQNNNASDISLVRAGEDIESINVGIAGPGELLVQASRNIDLSKDANVIIATGNKGSQDGRVGTPTANIALPNQGASITLQAGLGKDNSLPNVQGYIDQYILPTGAGPASLASDGTKLAEYKTNTTKAVTSFMRDRTGDSNLDDAQALAKFNVLDVEAKTIFANRHLSTELVAAAESNADERGFAAIAKLFPNKNAGDILLFKSKVATNSNGNIDFVAPSGEIVVGTTAAVTGDIGVLTRNGGSIRMFANGDIQVNNSKVITQAGGDIIMYSDNGDIDAGKGSKTATSSPETFVSTDADGNTTIEVIASSAGSGIRTDATDPDGPNGSKKEPKRGDAKLITPRGVVDASEGGIASNNLFIRALAVLNAENIQVQGVSSGVPLAATSSLAGVSAGLSPDSVNAATAAVAESVAQSANQQPFIKPILPSIINVEVISIGN